MKKVLSNKKILITVLSIILVLVVMSSTTYALFFKVHTMDNTESYTAGILDIKVEEGSKLELVNSLPITDEEGSKLAPYTLTVTNVGNILCNFNLKLLSTTISNQINANYIKIKINNNQPVTLSSLNDGIITKDLVLNPGESTTIFVKIWLSIDTPNTEIGKTFSAKIVTDAVSHQYLLGTDYIESLLISNPDTMSNDDPDGNIRYMGADPDNYIDIGDKYPEGSIVKKWGEINIESSTVEDCRETIESICPFSYESEAELECINKNFPNTGITNTEELISKYCVLEDKSNQPMLWRIIGVFNVKSSLNGEYEKKLKIIRDESLGHVNIYEYGTLMKWDEYENIDWSKSTLQRYLNSEYLLGLNEDVQKLFKDTVWNLGTISNYDDLYVASQIYNSERGNTSIENNPITWTGKIGLMYASDYYYATSGGETYNRNYCLNNSYFNIDCVENNYLDKSILLDPSSPYWVEFYNWVLNFIQVDGEIYHNLILKAGDFLPTPSSSVHEVRPTGYLDSTIKISGGEGTKDNPYTIVKTSSMNKSEITAIKLGLNINSGKPDYSQAARTDEGVFAAEDDLGTSYYFRGAVDNNYVKFAGFYWRIIRINGDGTIRMIYDGTSAHANGESSTDRQIGESVFNTNDDDNAYVGYMYGTPNSSTYEETHSNLNDSTIKEFNDNWYKTNIVDKGYSQYVADAIYCNDRKIYKNEELGYYGNGVGKEFTLYNIFNKLSIPEYEDAYYNQENLKFFKPNLTCSQENDKFTVNNNIGNGDLTYPIGLITVDEAVMAGAPLWYSWEDISNDSYYLYTGNLFWTMTPFEFLSDENYARLVSVEWGSFPLGVTFSSFTLGVKPVISLKSDIIFTGNGTMESPFEIVS